MTGHRAGEPPVRRHRRENRTTVRPPRPPVWPWVPRDRAEVALELLTLAISVPVAPMTMVGVAGGHLPAWCLVLAGMCVGWASDAVGVLFGHCMGLYRARRVAAWTPPDHHVTPDCDSSEQSGTDLRHGHQRPPHQWGRQ